MGKHVFTLNLRMEIEKPSIKDEETNEMLTVSGEFLHSALCSLRSDMFNDVDDLTAGEFEEAVTKAQEINKIISRLEEAGAVDMTIEEDEEEGEDI